MKGSGSKQDLKRTDGSSDGASDDSTQPITPFDESLHSTMKDQENIHQQRQNAGTTGKKSENTHKAGNQRQPKVNVSSTQYQAAEAKTVLDIPANSDAAQNPKQPHVQQSTATSADINAAAVPVALLTALVNLLPFSGSADSTPTTPGPSTVSEAVSDSKPAAINTAAAARPVNLDSQLQSLKGDQDTLVFDGTLHPAAPVRTAPLQAALPAAGRPAWLLNAQPVYTSTAPANPTADLPDQPRGAATTSDSNSKIPMQTGIPQPAIADVAPVSANPDGNPAQPEKIATGTGQTPEAPNTNINRQKPAPGSPQENSTPATLAERPGQTSSGQSSSGNLSGSERDAKHNTASPAPTRSPDAAAANGAQIFTSSDSGSKGVVDTAARSNNAAAASSKPGSLPIDQQADTRQPPMKTDLNMRIQGQSGENINLRISERAGDIQISVRSSDQSTANVLKHELPSIEAGLERAGWHVENGGMSQSGQEQREAGKDSQNHDRNRDQNAQSPNWQDRNQRRKDSSPNTWFEMDQ